MNRIIKKAFTLIMLFLISLTLVSCSKNEQADIITTLFPQYDIAKQITKDKLTVKLMTPFGTEVHGYEPTAKDIINIKNAKLFIYTSDQMERWAKNVITDSANSLNLSTKYTNIPYDNKNTSDNIHYWTDPVNILQLINVIRDEIVLLDSSNKDYYFENALSYYNLISSLNTEIKSLFEDKNSPSIYFYGHNAMNDFANRYNFNIISLSNNYKPDSELTQGQILSLKNKIIDTNAKYLFVEELISLKGPNALKGELENEDYQIELLELHGFHNISNKQNKEGVSYADLLKQNLENLKKALSRV